MKLGALVAAAMLIASASLSAHRLDEYLQAARVNLSRARVALEMDLTPGASVADTVLTLIDRDGDGAITPLEAESYGRAVLSDLSVEVDDLPIAMTLDHVEVPAIDEMRQGVGTIEVRATGDIAGGTGRRQLHFTNHHQPRSSVYLVNALVPTDDAVTVVSQRRDARQQDVRIDYEVSSQWPRYLYWPAVGAVVLILLYSGRRKTWTPFAGE